MATVLIKESTLIAIADAIRKKNGLETMYKPNEMPTAILALDGEAEEKPEVFYENFRDFIEANINATSLYIDAKYADEDGTLYVGDFLDGYLGNLQELEFGEGITRIIGGIVEELDNEPFDLIGRDTALGCKLIFPSTLKEISKCFYGAKLRDTLEFPEGVEIISDSFTNCSFYTVIIPSTIKRIDANSFERNSKVDVAIYIKGKPAYLSDDSFDYGNGGQHFYVSWKKAELAIPERDFRKVTYNYVFE